MEEIIGFAREIFYDFIVNQEKEIQKEMYEEMQKSIKERIKGILTKVTVAQASNSSSL